MSNEYRNALLELSNVELARAIHEHPNASAGLARLMDDLQRAEPAGDVTRVDDQDPERWDGLS